MPTRARTSRSMQTCASVIASSLNRSPRGRRRTCSSPVRLAQRSVHPSLLFLFLSFSLSLSLCIALCIVLFWHAIFFRSLLALLCRPRSTCGPLRKKTNSEEFPFRFRSFVPSSTLLVSSRPAWPVLHGVRRQVAHDPAIASTLHGDAVRCDDDDYHTTNVFSASADKQ